MQKLVSMGDNKELACLNSQERSATMLEDEATMFEDLALIGKINQDDVGQLLKIVKEGGEPKNVAQGQEVWEAATSIMTARAVMATVKTILTATEEALKPYGFYFENCSKNAGIVASAEKHLTQLNNQLKGKEILCSRRQEGVDDRVAVRTEINIEARSQQAARNQQLGDLLHQEIENIRKLMTTVSLKRPTAIKQRINSERKKAEDYEGSVSAAMQHKVWRPGDLNT